MVHVIGERRNLLLHKAEITILLLPSLKTEKYSTDTVLTKKRSLYSYIHTSQENEDKSSKFLT